MHHRHRLYARAAALTALVLFLAATIARADDWPQWRGPRRDGISRETGLLKSWPAQGPARVWEKPLGEGFSCVAVADGRLFTQFQADGAQWLVAFDAQTGRRLWLQRTGGPFTEYPGPRATPTVDGDRVYALDALGNLFCVKAADGAIVWQHNLMSRFNTKNLQWATASSPLIDGDRLIVNAGESKGASVLALNKMTGDLVWKALDDMAGYSSPIIHEVGGRRQLIFFLGTGPVGLDPGDGALLWRYPWKTSYDVHAATPIARGDRVFITSGYNVGCALLQVPRDGGEVREVWRSRVIRAHHNTPTLIGDYLYGFDDTIFCAVEFETGRRLWEQKGWGKGTHVVADGLAYILSENGTLVLARLTPERLEIISQVPKAMGRRCWTMPVVANGLLYLRDESKIACLDVRAKP